MIAVERSLMCTSDASGLRRLPVDRAMSGEMASMHVGVRRIPEVWILTDFVQVSGRGFNMKAICYHCAT